MNFIDLIILIIILGILGAIIYFNFIKKEKDVCLRCAYKKTYCNCNNKENRI